jgi:hypothetical protein
VPIIEKRPAYLKNPYKGYQLTQDQVLAALVETTSVKEAARLMNISYPTFKKYCKQHTDINTGQTLFDKFTNPAGRGINRNQDKNKFLADPMSVLKNGQSALPERVAKLKQIVFDYKVLPMICNKCGYHERRLTDMKPPLLLNFMNKNKHDWRKENLELLCYNCYFLYIGNPITQDLIKKVEAQDLDNKVFKEELYEFHKLDDVYLEHLKELGLDDGDYIDEEDTKDEDLVDYDDGSDLIDLV